VFSSVRTVADPVNSPASTIYSLWVEKTGLTIFLIRWVPHTLTGEMRQKRVELAGELLRVLEGQQRVGFRNIVTRDEWWFVQSYDHR
jgi:hypothetical protein